MLIANGSALWAKAPSMRHLGSLMAVLVFGACEPDSPTAVDAEPQAFQARLASAIAAGEVRAALQGRTERGPEDEILRLEARVPGIGGVFIDAGTGRFNVWIREESRREEARSAVLDIARAFAAEVSGSDGGPITLDPSTVDVRIGAFAFSDLLAWKSIVTWPVLSLPGVLGIDADEARNRILVTVAGQTAANRATERLASLDVPLSAVVVEVGPVTEATQTLESRVRPVRAGLQIDYGNECTQGWSVTTNQGEDGFLTAAHCSTSTLGGGQTGQSIWQPIVNLGGNPSNQVGQVLLNAPWNLSSCVDPVTQQWWTGLCTRADVMLVESGVTERRLTRPTSSCFGQNNQPAPCKNIGYFGSVGSISSKWVGMLVDKVGRTTGWTRGTLEHTCRDTKVTRGNPPVEYVVLCADRVKDASAGQGDSGSPVFRAGPDPARPLGVLFAAAPLNAGGGTQPAYCNSGCKYDYSPWQQINYHLSRYFDPTTPVPPLTTDIGGPSQLASGESCTWQALPSGGTPPYTYAWSGLLSGSGSSVSGTIYSGGWLNLTVTDSNQAQATDRLYISINPSAFCVE